MTIQDIKTILVNHLNYAGKNSVRANQELVDQIIRENLDREVELSEVRAIKINGTLVFLSESGFSIPNRVVFLDLKSKESFLHELE